MEKGKVMFNVGDKVAVYCRYQNTKIDEVIRITPTGRVRLKSHSEQFDKTGRQLGAKDSFYRCSITPLTKELEEEIIKDFTIRKAAAWCHSVKVENLDYETAKEIVKLLDKMKGEN